MYDQKLLIVNYGLLKDKKFVDSSSRIQKVNFVISAPPEGPMDHFALLPSQLIIIPRISAKWLLTGFRTDGNLMFQPTL